jgi:hypothetical protein
VTVSVPAIIDRATHDRLLAILADRSTGPRAGNSSTLWPKRPQTWKEPMPSPDVA